MISNNMIRHELVGVKVKNNERLKGRITYLMRDSHCSKLMGWQRALLSTNDEKPILNISYFYLHLYVPSTLAFSLVTDAPENLQNITLQLQKRDYLMKISSVIPSTQVRFDLERNN
uniref:Uncharacterized protein n=1 Tax=Glossina pallidipes TaxID=7398 RepID=A0A1A9Z5X1_GLOPL